MPEQEQSPDHPFPLLSACTECLESAHKNGRRSINRNYCEICCHSLALPTAAAASFVQQQDDGVYSKWVS